MRIEALRGLMARPNRLQMADGSTVVAQSAEFMHLPPAALRDTRTVVAYGPYPGDFKLLGALLILAATPNGTGQNGH